VRTTPTKEYVHEAQYVAEVDVTLMEDDHAWAPYFSIEDVRKLETVRRALQARDLAAAAKLAKVYELKPVAAEQV
jgi:LPS sulfotransferase NodH